MNGQVLIRLLLLLASLLWLSACSGLSGCCSSRLPGADLPAGSIVEVASGRLLDMDELVELLAAPQMVLLGEKHDNPEQHELQLQLLQALEQRRVQGSLVLEMLNGNQQPNVDRVRADLAAGNPPAQLTDALDWDPGWDWQLYGPLVEHAITRPWPLLAGNLDGQQMRAVYRNPSALKSAHAGHPGVQRRLRRIIHDSHCGLLPRKQLPAMLAVQQQRDLNMARTLLDADKPAMLIAGSYHVRKDLGVPLHLQDLTDDPGFVILIMLEEGSSYGQGMADYVWYTTAAEERDYCADL